MQSRLRLHVLSPLSPQPCEKKSSASGYVWFSEDQRPHRHVLPAPRLVFLCLEPPGPALRAPEVLHQREPLGGSSSGMDAMLKWDRHLAVARLQLQTERRSALNTTCLFADTLQAFNSQAEAPIKGAWHAENLRVRDSQSPFSRPQIRPCSKASPFGPSPKQRRRAGRQPSVRIGSPWNPSSVR